MFSYQVSASESENSLILTIDHLHPWRTVSFKLDKWQSIQALLDSWFGPGMPDGIEYLDVIKDKVLVWDSFSGFYPGFQFRLTPDFFASVEPLLKRELGFTQDIPLPPGCHTDVPLCFVQPIHLRVYAPYDESFDYAAYAYDPAVDVQKYRYLGIYRTSNEADEAIKKHFGKAPDGHKATL